MYQISFDSKERILHLRLEGFWTAATLARFTAEIIIKATAAKLRYGSFAMLSDSRNFPVQSTEIVRAFNALSARSMRFNPGPAAVVVGSTLNKLQAEHSLQSLNRRVFLDMEEAHAWLRAEWVSTFKKSA